MKINPENNKSIPTDEGHSVHDSDPKVVIGLSKALCEDERDE
jgi:hypothetical protein